MESTGYAIDLDSGERNGTKKKYGRGHGDGGPRVVMGWFHSSTWRFEGCCLHEVLNHRFLSHSLLESTRFPDCDDGGGQYGVGLMELHQSTNFDFL